MTSLRRRVRAAIAVAGLVALTAACGGDGEDSSPGPGAEGEASESPATGGDAGSLEGLTPEEISDRAQEALLSLDSVRLTTVGEPEPGGFGLDLHLDRVGSCEGSVTLPGTGSVEILMRGNDQVWMKPDSEFWQNGMGTSDTSLVSLLEGRYLYGTTSDPELAQMAGTCSLDDFMSDSAEDEEEEITAGEPTEHNGVPVIPLTATSPEGEITTLLVAAEGEPYPLLLSGESDGVQTEVELTDFNEPVEFEEPASELVLDVGDFRSGNIEA